MGSLGSLRDYRSRTRSGVLIEADVPWPPRSLRRYYASHLDGQRIVADQSTVVRIVLLRHSCDPEIWGRPAPTMTICPAGVPLLQAES